jgi:exopolysaccharide biosynthesis polyprenyl glycosylphosphotransferase
MEENRPIRKRDTYKRIITFSEGIILLAIEAYLFAMMWYTNYAKVIDIPFWRRGNWAVVGMYAIIIFLFTKLYGGYKVGFLRIMDVLYSQILSLICGNIVAYLELCIICRDYVNPVNLLKVTFAEVIVIFVWVFACRFMYRKFYPPRHLLLVYGYKTPTEFIDKINARKDKYVIEDRIHVSEGEKALKEKILQYDGVILCETKAYIRNELVKYCFEHSIRSYVVPKLSDIIILGAEPIHLFDTPLLLSRNQGLTGEDMIFKRIMDIIVSLIMIVVFSPFMIIIALAIKLYDGGPVIYKQDRLTLNGRVFKIMKFRSMRMDSEVKGAQLAKKHDDRITPVGRIIRMLHLDELPQLFNILKGDMSVVGPRPERPEIAAMYRETFPEFDYRLKMKAGLTGYAQVYGKYNTTPRDKVKLDLTYYEKYSIWLDIKLILLTFKILFQKENTEGIDANQTTAIRVDGKKQNGASDNNEADEKKGSNSKDTGIKHPAGEAEDAFYR